MKAVPTKYVVVYLCLHFYISITFGGHRQRRASTLPPHRQAVVMDPAQLQALQQAMASKGHEHKAPPATGACSQPAPIEDLERTTSVLNATNAAAVSSVVSFPAPA